MCIAMFKIYFASGITNVFISVEIMTCTACNSLPFFSSALAVHTENITDYITLTGSSDTFWLTGLECLGNETTLMSCDSSGDVHICLEEETAFLVCDGMYQ